MTTLLLSALLLPILGACLTAISRPVVAAFIAVLFSAAQFAAAIALLFGLSSVPGHGSIDFFLNWIPRIGLPLDWSVDSFRGPVLVAISFAFFLAVLWERRERGSSAVLLLINFGITGALLSNHILLIEMFWVLATLTVVFAQTLFGESGKDEPSWRFGLTLVGGHTAIFAALIALQHYSESQSLRLSELQSNGVLGIYRSTMLLTLYLGFMLTSGLWPLNGRWHEFVRNTKASFGIIQTAVLPGLGIYLFSQISLSAFSSEFSAAVPFFVVLSLTGALVSVLQIAQQYDIRAVISLTGAALSGLIATGVFSLQEAGIAGGLSLWIFLIPPFAGLGISAATFRRVAHTYRFRDDDGNPWIGGVSAGAPWLAGSVAALLIMVAAAPGSPALASVLAFVPAVANIHPGLVLAVFAVLAGLLGGLFWFYRMLFWGKRKSSAAVFIPDLRGFEQALLVPVAALVILAGFFPLRLIESLRPAIVKLLERLH